MSDTPDIHTRWQAYREYKGSGIEWLGAIPSQWNVRKLKMVADVQTSGVDKLTKDDEIAVELCNYTDVYYRDFITRDIEFMKATATKSEISRFELKKGDVIITKDSESANDIGIPSVVAEDLPGVLCAYHLALIRPYKPQMNGFYLCRSFMSEPLSGQFEVGANGVTRFGLPQKAIKDMIVLVPPPEEQRAIAIFLERETAKINELIATKHTFIERLKEKRSALISQAVTHGLNPDAPMKDSNVDWIGQIPKHWKAVRIKMLCQIGRGASPRPIDNPDYFDDDGEYAWVRIADVTASERYLETTTQRLSNLGKSLSVPLEPGEIFLSIAGSVGKAIITRIKCCIHDGFVYFKNLKQNKEFMYYVFSGGELYKGIGKQGTQLNLNTQIVGNIVIPVPPQNEQREIVKFLDRETEKLDQLIPKTQATIDTLIEYRTALISAAVTGAIDVRDEI